LKHDGSSKSSAVTAGSSPYVYVPGPLFALKENDDDINEQTCHQRREALKAMSLALIYIDCGAITRSRYFRCRYIWMIQPGVTNLGP
jgi:hypothetical protein